MVGREHVALTGSGSQANLLAVAAALSHLHERPLRAGDEVITPAIGFPTTVNPLYQNGLVPVYVDVELDTFNPSLEAIARRDRRAHARGHGRPLPGQPLRRRRRGRSSAREHDLVLIEDCCDALGSTLGGPAGGHVRPGRRPTRSTPPTT